MYNNRNKVLICGPNLELQGGIANYYEVLLKYLNNSNYTYFDLSNTNNKNKLFRKINQAFNIYLRFIYYLLNGHKIIHLNPGMRKGQRRTLIFIIISKLLKRRVIVFFRGWNNYYANKLADSKYSLTRIIYNYSDAIIVLSNESESIIRKMNYRKKVYIESTIVDESILNNSDKISDSKYESISGEKITLLYLARVEKYKGIYELIDAFEILKNKYVNIKMIIAGEGNEFNNINSLIEKRNIPDIEFTGYVRLDKKNRVFQLSDIYIFPSSHAEGMPNSVLEAMAFGLPVITTPVGGISDFFQEGKMGYLIENINPDDIADLTEKLINNPQKIKEISKYNREYAQEHFVSSKVANRIENIYSEVLSL